MAGCTRWTPENGFTPFRIDVDFLAAHDAPIRPLVADLTFIRSKTPWGAAFRFGFVRIPADHFTRIAPAMGCNFEVDFFAQPACLQRSLPRRIASLIVGGAARPCTRGPRKEGRP